MITWGISANSHDAALAVFVNKELVFASHAERFSGIKNDAHLNTELIEYARRWGEPNEVVWYENPYKKTLRQLYAGQGWNWKENNIKHYLNSYGITAPIKYTSHHHSHAAAGYYTSTFDDATVICIDSIGEFETLTIWEATASRGLKKIYSQGYPHSVGLWYSAMTQRVGLKPNEDEYILMGMAAYGNPRPLWKDMYEMFDYVEGPDIRFKKNLHRGCKDWNPGLGTAEDKFNIAASTQKTYEFLLEQILHWAKKNTRSRNLVLMGGCALNCSANSLAYRYFDNVWIMPNPGDAGSAVGAVLAKYKTHIKWNDSFLGYNIEGDYPIEEVIKELKTVGICGVANGKAEYGPRAFGNRSLLADPRISDIKDRVNDIKQRQRFRPFAPVILSEHYDEHFDGYANEYMQFTARCRYPDLYPSITHADGTSRVQVVGPDGSGIRKLLEAWYAETGCPLLLNTSLNIKGKPMVNQLTDAEEFAKLYNIKVFTGKQ
jgi:carbamoyltransferase